MKIGEIIPADREIVLNEGKKTTKIQVANKGDRPVQVGSHFHFFEVNKCLSFDREAAYGYHLDIPSGTSVRFEPGEEKEVRIRFDDKTFRFYDTRTDSWEIESGTYQIMIGENAQQMVLECALDVKGTVENGGYKKEELPEYFSGKIKDISDEKFRILYGREIPDGSWSGEIRMNDAVCQLYYGIGILGKLLCAILKLLLKISDWKG